MDRTDVTPRDGERVRVDTGRRRNRYAIATATPYRDASGAVGMVFDGDQTGAVRFTDMRHVTRLTVDVDRLHASALLENALRR
jgi:hypothetical protein